MERGSEEGRNGEKCKREGSEKLRDGGRKEGRTGARE